MAENAVPNKIIVRIPNGDSQAIDKIKGMLERLYPGTNINIKVAKM